MPNTTHVSLDGDRAVRIEREFQTSLEKVWRAYTDPALFIQWIGPRGLKGKVDAWGMKEGGAYGYTHTDEKGVEYHFRGWRVSIAEGSSIVETFEWMGMPGHISLNTARFEKLGDGKAKVTATAVFQSPADRDGMIQGGMEHGIVEGNERLDELLARL